MVAKNERSKDRRKAGRATWRVPTLIRRALTAKNEDSAWECIMVLHRRRTPEVFTAATELCRSKKALEREVGADILSQARAPDKNFSIDALKVLHRMLRNESDPGVLNCVLEAIGHAQDAAVLGLSRRWYGGEGCRCSGSHSCGGGRGGIAGHCRGGGRRLLHGRRGGGGPHVHFFSGATGAQDQQTAGYPKQRDKRFHSSCKHLILPIYPHCTVS